MGVGIYMGIVKGRRNACHAFVGMLFPTSYECDIVRQGGTQDEYILVISGTSKYGLSLSDFGLLGKYRTLTNLPEDDDEAEQAGIDEMRRLQGRAGIQACSKICDVEVQVTHTYDEDREEKGDRLAYVHYVNGKGQGDSWTNDYPRELDMPVGGDV